jgi:hypothetical protein
MRYRASSYKSEVLRLWPQRCNTAKPTRVTTVSHKYSRPVASRATVVVAVSSTVHYTANYYKIETYYLR